jgi:non-ribosomal peptide synthetase component F
MRLIDFFDQAAVRHPERCAFADRDTTFDYAQMRAFSQRLAAAMRKRGISDNARVANLHALLSENLMADPEASGHLRRRPVEITGSVYTPPRDTAGDRRMLLAHPFESGLDWRPF